uniref:BMA-INSC-1, isoform b n=1 Tax=Brugia malayi TaxID=6279 RepID=A0A1I9G094_BRUMA|nr:BMA-INSC-1, isoform b [Brugia malayi]
MTSVPVRALNALCSERSRNIQEWLTELTISSEPECNFILYAKSFLDITEQQQLSVISNNCKDESERIHLSGTSSLPPAKSKRCIARMTSSSSGHIMTASTPVSLTNTEKHRTTVCYQFDEGKITPIKCNPAPISAFIRVKSCNNSDNNDTDQMKSEMNELSSKTFDKSMTPVIPACNAPMNFSLTNRSITPKIFSKAYGCRYRLHGRTQRLSYRSNLQQHKKQQRQNEMVKVNRKSNNQIATIMNKTITTSDSNSNTLLVESSSTLEVNSDKRIMKSDDQSISIASEQKLICSRNQPNHSNQLLLHNTNDNDDDLVNYETIYEKQTDSSRKCANNEVRNSSKQENDSQSSILSFVDFRKPPETPTSIQKKLESSKSIDSPSSYNRNQLSRNRCVRVSHKTKNHGQLGAYRINGETVLQVHLDAPSSSQAIKSISNTSRCFNHDTNDGIESASTGVSISAALGSVDSSTNSSVDSGQGSTELSTQNCSFKDSFNYDKTIGENSLPSYARVANTIDHVLRVCSTFHAALNNEMNEKWTSDIICEAKVLIATIQSLPCITFLSPHDIATVQQMISDLESDEKDKGKPINASNFLIVLLRKIIHEILIIFARIISTYLAECSNRDRLLVIALEHFIHLMLFGDEICHIIIQCGGLDSLLYFCEVPSISNGTLRLLLRALTILCGNCRGAMKLLALNKFELIIQFLFTSTIACSAEAAGILTQLTNPNQNYVRLGSIMRKVVVRILEIVDKSKVAESLLLALAALANITVQEAGTIDVLYEHNAIKRFIQAYKRPKCHNVFIEEQLLTIFISLANGAYIEALIGQGAVNLLLSLLQIHSQTHLNYCKRIQLRATQCLRKIANYGIGLKAIHEMNGYSMITKVIQDNNALIDAKNNLWWITEQLEKKYQLESAV